MFLRAMHLIPFFGVILLIYWLAVQVHLFPRGLNYVMFFIPLPSGVTWRPTWGDFLVLLGVFFLYIELFKSTRTSETTIFDHLLSTLVLILYMTAWLTSPWAGNSVFLILTGMAFLDVVAGFTITISAARRDLSLGGK